MTHDLLRFYNEELAYLREMGAEFATAYPKVAGRLGLEAGEASDPHVERLLEGVAFLSARVQAKLRARFPDFTQALLDVIYPHFNAPVPSMTIATLKPDPAAGRLEKGFEVPRGSRLISQVVPSTITACEFRTAQDVHLWPIELRSVSYVETGTGVAALQLPHISGQSGSLKAALRLRIGTTNGMALQTLTLRELVLHFPAEGGTGPALLQQVLADCAGIILRPVERPSPWQERLPPSSITHVFDAPEHALLPPVPRSFSGYRLLQEYFALPDRMLFVKLSGLADAIAASDTSEIEIVFALRRRDPRLERQLRRDNVRLFATPAINLFEKITDRIMVDHRNHEFHIVPDRVRPLDLELHSVLSVEGELTNGKRMPFHPLYGITQLQGAETVGHYTLRRQTRTLSQQARHHGNRTNYVGTEGFLTLADPAAPPFRNDLQQLSLRCLCTNRDLPLMLPCGQGSTDFTLEIGAPVTEIRCLTLPTRPSPSPAQGDIAWSLISHLSLNYLSVTDEEDGAGAAALREMLSLYAPSDRPDLARRISGLERVSSAPAIRRIPGGGVSAVARGVEVTLHMDEASFEGTGSFTLAAVLSRFFAQHASINSFAETALSVGHEGVVARWPAISGQRAIL